MPLLRLLWRLVIRFGSQQPWIVAAQTTMIDEEDEEEEEAVDVECILDKWPTLQALSYSLTET